MKHSFYLLLLMVSLLCGCTSNTAMESTKQLKKGSWRATLQLTETEELPFNFEVDETGVLYIMNAQERIRVEEISYAGDTVKIILPVFGTYILAQNKGDSLIGHWVNTNKDNYEVPFYAVFGRTERFAAAESVPNLDVNGRWEVHFSPNVEGTYPAIAIFEQKGSHLTGTFLTETGDYRFLEGQVEDGKLMLSCFEGAHLFLFKANLVGDSLVGQFWSGKHWNEPWVAKRNPNFQLAAMDTLTHLKAGYHRFDFKFPNSNGDSIHLSENPKYSNKVIIVQILGSWCPNCMDETRFLAEIDQKYKDKGLEIIGIDYEIRNDFEVFKRNVERMRKDLGFKYECVFGGSSKKSEAALTLPMLNHVLSYPTTIFIDKKGQVRSIHTGFNGPGTGQLYVDYKAKTTKLLEELLNE